MKNSVSDNKTPVVEATSQGIEMALPENYIDCRSEEKTVVGGLAHTLYFKGDYITNQAGDNLFAVYDMENDKPVLVACQSTLEGALPYTRKFEGNHPVDRVLILLKPN